MGQKYIYIDFLFLLLFSVLHTDTKKHEKDLYNMQLDKISGEWNEELEIIIDSDD